MRLHAEEPAYHAALAHCPPGDKQSVVVLLDGIEQHEVIMADEEAGVLTRYEVDEAGKLKHSCGHAQIQRRLGTVLIIVPTWWPK